MHQFGDILKIFMEMKVHASRRVDRQTIQPPEVFLENVKNEGTWKYK